MNGYLRKVRLKQLEDLIIKNKEGITVDIPENLKLINEITTVCTFYDGETKTWGLISRPNKYRVIFRLKNPVSTRLKQACSALINALRSKEAQEILVDEKFIASQKKYINLVKILFLG